MAASSTTAAASTSISTGDKTLQDELALPILLTDRIIKAAGEAESSRSECADIARQADELAQKLRAAVRLTSSSPSTIYDRPILRIAADVSKNLERALTLVRKCKHSGLLRHVFLTITSSAADFRKVSNLLQSSIADFVWLLSLYSDDDEGGGANLGLPPIVSNDPIFGWVWSSIASLQVNRQLRDRIDAANYLAEFARQNQRYRKVIVEEGAVSPLLKLLKDGSGSLEGQIAAARALFWLVDEKERTRIVAAEGGISVIVQVLGESCTSVQIVVAELVARVAEIDLTAREEFGKENVLKSLISCLIVDVDMEEYKRFHGGGGGKTSIHSIVQKELAAKNHHNYGNPLRSHVGSNSYHKVHSSPSLNYNNNRKDRENESPEVKLKLKINCALALCRLCEGSLLNSQKITEPKGLFCLSKIIETERGELQYNCLMTVMEVAKVAEGNADIRKVAWKPSSPPAKAVLDQLLRVIKEDNPSFQIPAIKAIGCLARIFPAKETGIVSSLVGHLGNGDVYVATEAAIALAKFACPDNHNCVAHSKTIIEFNGVPPLMKLLSKNESVSKHGLVLLCYLSMHVGNSKELAAASALRALEVAVRSAIAQNAGLKDLLSKAVHHLMLYQDASHPHKSQPSYSV